MKKRGLIVILIFAILMLVPSLAATGHIDGCTNTGDPAECCAKLFNIVPKPGYKIVELIINGISQPVSEQDSLGMIYRFDNITEAQTLKVVTEAMPIQISFDTTTKEGTQGCYPATFELMPGETRMFYAVTKPGYMFQGISTSDFCCEVFDEGTGHEIEYVGKISSNMYEYRITAGTARDFRIGAQSIAGNGIPNAPVIREGEMVPVKWDEAKGKWVITTVDDPDWYNYNSVAENKATHNKVGGDGNGKWANVMTLDGLTYYQNGTSGTAKSVEIGTELETLKGKYIATQGSQYVWIPRYTYKIESGYRKIVEHDTYPTRTGVKSWNSDLVDGTEETLGKIVIKWSNGIEDDTSDSYIVHPAFRFARYIGGNPGSDSSYDGEITELTGIWLAKYEASNVKEDVVVDIPGETYAARFIPEASPYISYSKKNDIIPYYFYNRYINAYNTYRNADSHMMKNTEWGAVAYLTNAIGRIPYTNIGMYSNGNNSYRTGYSGTSQDARSEDINSSNFYLWNTKEGVKASTTHNVYGIYDMSGGNYEVVAWCDEQIESFEDDYEKVDKKYLDIYNSIAYKANNFGDAMYETSVGVSLYFDYDTLDLGEYLGVYGGGDSYSWDGDGANLTDDNLFIVRGKSRFGSDKIGIFSFETYNGGAYNTFRVTLAIPKNE